MSLFSDIQSDLADTGTSLESALFKCQRLAARLGSAEFRQWVSRELEGYEGVESLPPYREIGAMSLGHIMGPFGSEAKNMPVPVLPDMPDNVRHFMSHVELRHSVAELESLVADKDNEGLRFPWPTELVQLYSPRLVQQGSQLVAVDRIVSASAVRGALSKIRRRLLEFILEVESTVPEASGPHHPEDGTSSQQVTQIFNTTVYGGNVALASSNLVQGSTSSVIVGDVDSLARFLERNGVAERDIVALKRAIKGDTAHPDKGRFGKRVAKWISKMTKKAASGAWKVGLAVGARLLYEALARYYGWSS